MNDSSKMRTNPSYQELRQRVDALEKEVADRKFSRQRIKHLNAVLNSVRNVNHLTIKEKNREQLIRKICHLLVESRCYHNAWIVLMDEIYNPILGAEAGLGEHFTKVFDEITYGNMIYCCKQVLVKPQLLTIQNPLEVCTDCPLSMMYNGRGAMSRRLEHEGKVYGLLTVSVPLDYSRDEQEHQLFEDVAGDIAFALHNIELERERKRAEAALRDARDELEKRVKDRTNELELLSSKLLSAQEEERKRIAGDLHDGIGQSLSAIKFMVETALDRSNNNFPDIHALQKLVPMLQKASEEVRTIVMNLRPSILDDLGIRATIGWFCRQFKTIYANIDIEKDIDITETNIPDDLKTNIFRVLQEAMNNIAKHSQAGLVKISLTESRHGIDLKIEDNGVGFNVDHLSCLEFAEKGFGITGMKERTELSGGKFRLVSAPDKGTAVQAIWPRR